MLDDHDAEAGALPVVRAYERTDVAQFLAAVEQEAAHLEARLVAARERRARAERGVETGLGRSSGVSAAVHLALDELGREEQASVAAIADLRARSVREALRILTEAEHEVLVLRAAIEVALDELDGDGDGEDGGRVARPTLVVAPALTGGEPRTDDLAARRERHDAHPSAGRPDAGPSLRSVSTGPSMAG